jgi:hypothetical protein
MYVVLQGKEVNCEKKKKRPMTTELQNTRLTCWETGGGKFCRNVIDDPPERANKRVSKQPATMSKCVIVNPILYMYIYVYVYT